MQKFYTQSMQEILKVLQEQVLSLHVKEKLSFEVLNPDIATSTYSGNFITINNIEYMYRTYKSWIDLAHILGCRMLTPTCKDTNFVIISYEKLNHDESFHNVITNKEKKYGTASIFSKIHKNQEASFLHTYLQALENVHVNKRTRILNLGVNSGNEFELIKEVAREFENLELVGIDYCASAIKEASEKFSTCKNVIFYTHDINDMSSLNLSQFDLIISIGTLQSTNLEFNQVIMNIVQNYLKKDGAIILGFPNCRWVGGEMIYGARVKNYPFSEMGLLYKDVIFAKKYLQQKKYRVTVTGKDYIFVTATSIR